MQAEPITATTTEPATTPNVVPSSVLLAEPVLDAIVRLLAKHVITEITTKSVSQEPQP
jgi:hypothetical protein